MRSLTLERADLEPDVDGARWATKLRETEVPSARWDRTTLLADRAYHPTPGLGASIGRRCGDPKRHRHAAQLSEPVNAHASWDADAVEADDSGWLNEVKRQGLAARPEAQDGLVM